ncbi:MAG: hypothetical protein ABI376_11975 [Caulobacteraceae bacterium]
MLRQGVGRLERRDEREFLPAASPTCTARIALTRSTIEVDGRRRPLIPGMAVTAEVRTGRRSIVDYLFSPLARKTSEAMHER